MSFRFSEGNVRTADDTQKKLRAIKSEFDHLIRNKTAFAPHDVGALSIFYAWWAFEFKDQKSLKTAHRLREIAAFWSLTNVRNSSLQQTSLANHFYLKIWEEMGQPSPLWQRGLPLARKKLKKVASEVLQSPRAYELFCGATGLALVGLQIGEHDVVNRCLKYLEASLRQTPFGKGYYTTPMFIDSDHTMPRSTRRFSPGLAHGAAGPLLFAKYASRMKEFEAPAQRLVTVLSDSLVAMVESHTTVLSVYPADEWTSQMAGGANWCTGFAGIGFALAASAKLTSKQRPALLRSQKIGRALLREASTPRWMSQIDDEHVCHGRAGTAQVFLRAKMDVDLLPRLIEPTLASPLVLLGSLGVGFSLLSEISDYDVPWDRMFLLSPPFMSKAQLATFKTIESSR